MPGPLDGYRVIDLTSMISGPLATMMLGDQGADVIKVEAPGHGDFVRSSAKRRNGLPAIFLSTNRSKRSIAIDLKQPRGLEILAGLVAETDVFVQNFRPGTAERMGIGEEAMRKIRPDLVYVSISGFGERGPYAGRRVYDPVIQALSGLAAIQADQETGRPRLVRLIVPDKLTAITAAQAITAALLSRERTGKGQHVRLAMLDAMVAFLWPEGMAGHTIIEEGVGNARPLPARDLIYATADGYITVAVMSDAEWRGLSRALERPEWFEDARFATPVGRSRHADERLAMTAEVLVTRSSHEWLERLNAEQVPCAPVLRREDLLDDPQIAANELIVELEHPHAGRIRQPRPAARFDHTPAEIRRPAPLLGEHTDELLSNLGVSAAEIAVLRREGVVS
ncbi:MAG: CoA transferase [Myxococcota bacterium]